MPTTIRITQADIDNIAKKLDELAEVLTDRECTIFLTMMQLAGKELRERLQSSSEPPRSPPSSSSSLPPLSAGFRSAFQPGVGARLTYAETGDSELRVSIIVEK
jgi:hypothetical protein